MYGVESFSLWCDFVERDFLDGEFRELLEKRVVNGATTNPSIFKSAFLTSSAYKKDRDEFKSLKPKEIYEKLAIEDIRRATTIMQDLYDSDNDGFISIEVDPNLCDNAKETIEEGKRLFKTIGKKNVMIKIPATSAGFIAMEELMSEGIHVNATLVFSPNQAKGCMEAFQRASLKFDRNSRLPRGVISVFVSRFDSKLDSRLRVLNLPTAKVGIYNATKIYDLVESYELSHVRTLFASTGVKSDALEADYYIKELLFKNSVNTAPLHTIKAFIASDEMVERVPSKDYIDFFDRVSRSGVDIQEIYDQLLKDGLDAFKRAFKEILDEL
jgi:transaldolase